MFILFNFFFYLLKDALSKNCEFCIFISIIIIIRAVDTNDLEYVLSSENIASAESLVGCERLHRGLAVLARCERRVVHERMQVVGHVEQAVFGCFVFVKKPFLTYKMQQQERINKQNKRIESIKEENLIVKPGVTFS